MKSHEQQNYTGWNVKLLMINVSVLSGTPVIFQHPSHTQSHTTLSIGSPGPGLPKYRNRNHNVQTRLRLKSGHFFFNMPVSNIQGLMRGSSRRISYIITMLLRV